MRHDKRAQIVPLLREGVAYNEIARRVGCAKSTVAYHAKNIGVAPGFRDYCWAEVQEFYDQGNSVQRCKARFGFSGSTWYKACAAGEIIPRQARFTLEALLVDGRGNNRGNLKARLIRNGLMRPECDLCKLAEWRGIPLSLELHHRNGKNNDDRLENLQLLCPNCHSQTPTYSGRNRRCT